MMDSNYEECKCNIEGIKGSNVISGGVQGFPI